MEYELFKGKLRKVGADSLTVTVPKRICEFCGFQDEMIVDIKIRKAKEPLKEIEEPGLDGVE